MADTERFPAVGKSEKKQNGKKRLRERLEGKKQMIALWTTVLGLLSAQGIPAVVEALSDKPSTGQVQAMIGKQTQELTRAQHAGVAAIQEVDKKLSELLDDNSEHRTVTGRLEGTVSLLRDVLRDCCTRRRARGRLDKPVVDAGSPHVSGAAHMIVMAEHDDSKKLMDAMTKSKKAPVERLEKVPEFNVQQHLQIQMPEE